MAAREGLSEFKFYSYGIVANNKKRDSYEIEVSPIEDIPFADGELTSHVKKDVTKGVNSDAGHFETEVKTTNSIKATWLPMNQSNRKTAPDVRRGESVSIYRFGDSDKYWWSTMKDEAKIRKAETVIYAYGATVKEGEELNASNCYFMEVNGHDGHITLQTSKANNEVTKYTLQLDCKKGTARLKDEVGNEFKVDSVNNTITLTQHQGNNTVLTNDTIEFNHKKGSNSKITPDTIEFNQHNGNKAKLDNDNIELSQNKGNSAKLTNNSVELKHFMGSLVGLTNLGINLNHAGGNSTKITEDVIELKQKAGNSMKLTANTIELSQHAGNSAKINDTSIELKQYGGNEIKVLKDDINVTQHSGNSVDITNDTIKVKHTGGNNLLLTQDTMELIHRAGSSIKMLANSTIEYQALKHVFIGDVEISRSIHVAGNIESNGGLHAGGPIETNAGVHSGGDINSNGNINVSGKLEVAGSMHGGGTLEINSTIHSGGDINSNGSIIDTTGNTNHHSHPLPPVVAAV